MYPDEFFTLTTKWLHSHVLALPSAPISFHSIGIPCLQHSTLNVDLSSPLSAQRFMPHFFVATEDATNPCRVKADKIGAAKAGQVDKSQFLFGFETAR